MSDMNPVPHARRGATPQIADGLHSERQPSRQSARSSARIYTPPEPHEKFHLDADEIPSDMDAMWLPTRIAGAPNDKVGQYFRAGWQPAAAKDFERISGYGVEYPQSMIDAGLLENIKPDAAIIVDDQMLVLRPKELSQRAKKQLDALAGDQVDNQMRRLRQASRAFRGTEIKYRQHAPLPDSARYEDE
jgi:hypothetical protein